MKRADITARRTARQAGAVDVFLEYAAWVNATWRERRDGCVKVPERFLGYWFSPAPVVGKGVERQNVTNIENG